MKKISFILMLLLVVTSCSKDEISSDLDNAEEFSANSSNNDCTSYLATVTDFEYISHGNYIAAGTDNHGNEAFFFGNHPNNWELINKNTSDNIWGTYLNATYNADAPNGVRQLVYAYRNGDGYVVTNGGIIKSRNKQPTFLRGQNVFRYRVRAKNPDTGKWEDTGETEIMTEFLDLDWSEPHQGYIISGKTETGRPVTFFSKTGIQGSWKYRKDGANNAWGRFVASEFGQTSARWSGVYCYIFKDGYVVTNGIYGNHKGPRFFRGKHHVGPKGDRLTSVITFDYVPSAQMYVITGESEQGGIATYYGNHRAWVKYNSSNNSPNAASWGPYLEVAFDDDPDGNGKYNLVYLFDRDSEGKINSNGGNEHNSGAPRHNSGGRLVKYTDADCGTVCPEVGEVLESESQANNNKFDNTVIQGTDIYRIDNGSTDTVRFSYEIIGHGIVDVEVPALTRSYVKGVAGSTVRNIKVFGSGGDLIEDFGGRTRVFGSNEVCEL